MFGRGKKKKGTTSTAKDKEEVDMNAIAKETTAKEAKAKKEPKAKEPKAKKTATPTQEVISNGEPQAKFVPYQSTKDEKYMNDKQRVHFSNILNSWKLELMEEVDETISELKEASTSILADPNDRATQEETFSLELRTRDRERKLIKKIEEALQKIKDKEYGYCDACGIEIGIRRLEARPTANLCIDCKTIAEIQEKRS